ncbi:hypothetical protein ACF3MZ_20570 [Paenibacillaceae bacterium WGS1546]|uniref:hypothetical protein n=1 Tax=Cohnella sp. WGS1546 TaxID=3366810 RepID=UPI00372D7920
MDKQRYYVSVSAGIVGTEPSLIDQLTVFATAEERNELISLLERDRKSVEDAYLRMYSTFDLPNREADAERSDEKLIEIFRYIYRIGTIETKRRLEGSGILKKPGMAERDRPGGSERHGRSGPKPK